jgi:putative transposase
MTTNEYIRGVKQNGWHPFPGKLWQRNYYEHIIRNENEMNRIREYITNNPAQWATDRENPMTRTTSQPDDSQRTQDRSHLII